jgi:hypothetical protein
MWSQKHAVHASSSTTEATASAHGCRPNHTEQKPWVKADTVKRVSLLTDPVTAGAAVSE